MENPCGPAPFQLWGQSCEQMGKAECLQPDEGRVGGDHIISSKEFKKLAQIHPAVL